MTEVLVPFVNYLVILDAEGDRLLAKYYDGRSKGDQQKNESTLYKKTKTVSAKTEAEVLMMENEIVVFKAGAECKFYIGGPTEENELILLAGLDVIYEAVSSLLKGQVDKRTMLDNLELVLLTIDEVLDHGQIMELDSGAVVSRVLMKHSDSIPQQAIGDLTISQALSLARVQLVKSLASNGGRGESGY